MNKQEIQNSKIWIARNGSTYGPYVLDSLRQFIAEGRCSKEDLAWDAISGKWIPLHAHPHFSRVSSSAELNSEKDLSPSEKAAKIQELLGADQEEFAIDLMLSGQSPEVFEILLAQRVMRYRHYGIPPTDNIDDWLEIRNRFDFELLLNRPENLKLDPFLEVEKKKGLHVACSWELKISDLFKFKNLEKLKLDANSGSKICLEELTELENLRVLELSHCEDHYTGWESVFALEHLTKLVLVDYRQDIDDLKNLNELETLSLTGSGEGRSTIGIIASLTKLKSLSLGGWADLESLDGLENLGVLEELNLAGCEKISSIEPLFFLTNLSKIETGWTSLKVPWSLDAFKLMARTGLSLDSFRDQIEQFEEGPELAEEMLASFQSLDSEIVGLLEDEDFEDLVHLAFVCAERFNLKKWFNAEREALGDEAFNFLADAASQSPSKLLIVAKFNNGQCYSNVYLARELIDRAIALFDDEKQDLALFLSILERCMENYIHPDGITKICAKIRHLSLHEMEIWDLQEWTDEFETESGSYLSLPEIEKFVNLESYSHELNADLPAGLEKLPKLTKLHINYSFEQEELIIPESMINLREIITEEVENLRTLNDLSVFPNLETIDLYECCNLEKPDWLEKIDRDKVDLICPEHWEEEK